MSRLLTVQLFVIVCLLSLPRVPVALSQPAGGYLSSDVLPGSSTVLITRITRKAAAGDQLELLVLWRGAPGWYLQRPRGSSTGERNGVLREEHQYGNVKLRIIFDPKASTVEVNEERVLLDSGARALLVDHVGTNEPLTVEKLKIDRNVSSGGAALLKLFRDSTALREFLRCEGVSAERPHRSYANTLCAAF